MTADRGEGGDHERRHHERVRRKPAATQGREKTWSAGEPDRVHEQHESELPDDVRQHEPVVERADPDACEEDGRDTEREAGHAHTAERVSRRDDDEEQQHRVGDERVRDRGAHGHGRAFVRAKVSREAPGSDLARLARQRHDAASPAVLRPPTADEQVFLGESENASGRGHRLCVPRDEHVSHPRTRLARIPDGEIDGAAQAQPELSSSAANLGLYLPLSSDRNSIDSWISHQMMRRAASLEAKFSPGRRPSRGRSQSGIASRCG